MNMKNILVLILIFYSLISYSQSETSMKPIMDNINELVSKFENDGYEIIKIEFDIVSLDSKYSHRELYPNIDYTVAILGDFRSEDMDIVVYKQKVNGQYILVTSDTKISPYDVVSFTPDEKAWYRFDISCYRMKPNYSSCHYGLIILHK